MRYAGESGKVSWSLQAKRRAFERIILCAQSLIPCFGTGAVEREPSHPHLVLHVPRYGVKILLLLLSYG